MSLIRRNTTRTIKNTTETTAQTDTPSATTVAFDLLDSDKFYLGFRKPFASRYFLLGTANTAPVVTQIKYWDGSDYASVQDLIDQTLGFTQSGFISWANETDWQTKAQSPITDAELFWLELSVSDDLSASTTLQAVLNLFCEQTLLQAYYPELISDTRYLPSGKTDFMDQYVAAKDLIVQRLKQDKLIKDESQILDINQIAVAAVHACAWIILNPIARSDEDRAKAADAWESMTKELNKVAFDLDLNDSGIIEDSDKEVGQIFRMRG